MNLPALYNALGTLADRADCPAWAIEVTDRQGNPITDVRAETIKSGGNDGSTIIRFSLLTQEPNAEDHR